MECSVGGRPSIKRYFKIRDAFIIPVFLLMCEKGEVLLGKERDYYWGAALLFTSLFFIMQSHSFLIYSKTVSVCSSSLFR